MAKKKEVKKVKKEAKEEKKVIMGKFGQPVQDKKFGVKTTEKFKV